MTGMEKSIASAVSMSGASLYSSASMPTIISGRSAPDRRCRAVTISSLLAGWLGIGRGRRIGDASGSNAAPATIGRSI